MIWADRVAGMGNRKFVYGVLLGSSEANSSLGRLGLDGKMIFKWIFYRRYVLG